MKRPMKCYTKNTKGATDAQDSTATADSKSEEEEDKIPVFDNIFDIFKSPFTEDVENPYTATDSI